MTSLALLVSTFCLVFFLGLQSQLVNNGHHLAAFLNSLAIGASNLVLFKLAPDATGWDHLALWPACSFIAGCTVVSPLKTMFFGGRHCDRNTIQATHGQFARSVHQIFPHESRRGAEPG